MIDKKQIVKVAMRRYIYFGIFKTTFNDIAKVLNVPPGQIYQCYPVKDLLTIAVMEQLLRKYCRTVVDAVDSSKNFRENLLCFLNVRCAFVKTHYRIYLTLQTSMKMENYQKLEGIYKDIRMQIHNQTESYVTLATMEDRLAVSRVSELITILDKELIDCFRFFQRKLVLNQKQLTSIFDLQYKICDEFLTEIAR